ncbi:MAG: bifunctional phosphoribosylaminoimidazolecarboxamide formyltransferase/IMP cyclohydrolase [Phycisphaeraceae bacterium]|nr:bifunctional phosphoribosylaminoimidazolecarboxamide formyltransferase/IMP cyclohydrolase [Phycisphaeraceae bacterium]
MTSDLVPVRRALISVSDKTDLVPFARRLAGLGVQIISTGGTAKAIADAGIPVTPIDQVTGFPEMMDGRVKTLHPKVHGGILALRDEPSHVQAMKDHGIDPIDLVCVNLYPFEKTVAKPDVTTEQAIEHIDIGGPSMVRSAAKNHAFVAIVTDPSQYDRVSAELQENKGATTLALRRSLAAAAFAHTSAYDAAIVSWMSRCDSYHPQTELFPDPLVWQMRKLTELRYGENPHQLAAVYAEPGVTEPNVVSAKQLHGKELSFNNLNDAAAALELIKEFDQPAAAVIKHTNPCGCGLADNLATAFERAYSGDPLAAFGGIVALSRTVDTPTAEAITSGQKFLEVILAPDYEPAALHLLRQRWQNVRLLAVGKLTSPRQRDPRVLDVKRIVGGLLVQQRDMLDMQGAHWQQVAGPKPTDAVVADLRLAWCAVKHLKSNAICLVRNQTLVGAGAGQMDRVESAKIAVAKAGKGNDSRAQGASAASDAFFPFRDGPDVLIDAGVTAIIQPGGSKRDDETIQACKDADVTLIFTGQRHFRH